MTFVTLDYIRFFILDCRLTSKTEYIIIQGGQNQSQYRTVDIPILNCLSIRATMASRSFKLASGIFGYTYTKYFMKYLLMDVYFQFDLYGRSTMQEVTGWQLRRQFCKETFQIVGVRFLKPVNLKWLQCGQQLRQKSSLKHSGPFLTHHL